MVDRVRRAEFPEEGDWLRDAKAIFRFFMPHESEVVNRKVDPGRAMQSIAQVIREGAAWIVEDERGVSATIGLLRAESLFTEGASWYDAWTLVRRDRRGGEMLAFLGEVVGRHCDETGMDAHLGMGPPAKAATARKVGRLARVGAVFVIEARGVARP